ncbi:PAS domain-containing sensor histidine kinase [bacterium]|nr:PAS domain-containing sensor histidine kinase [bacterium]MCI0601635.1 PAS domain-containing sensor histidine kinase [bacterium]
MTDLHALLVNEAPFAIVAFSIEGTILFWNKTAENLFGFTPEESTGQSVHSLIVPPSHREESQKAIEVALQQGRLLYECIRRNKAGAEFPVEVHLIPQMHDQKIIVLSTVRILPEQNHQEVFRRRSLQETTEFLANMSHEFRTPLNCIIGFTELLLDDKPGSLNTKQKEYLEDVLVSGKQLLNLLNAVLDLAKIDAGKVPIAPEEFEVKTAIQQVLSIFAPVAARNNVEIISNVAKECGPVRLDLLKFKQVIHNLLSHAIKTADPGSQIEILMRKSADKNLEMVLTLEGLQKGGLEAGGLDLLITKKILELQQGSLSVENASGFTVKWPTRWPVSS